MSKPKQAIWEEWSCILSAEVWEAVALSLGAEPKSLSCSVDWFLVDSDYSDLSEWQDFNRWVRIAANHVENGTLPATRDSRNPARSTVQLADFADWAESVELSLPAQFPRKSNPNSACGAPGSTDAAQSGHGDARGREMSAASITKALDERIPNAPRTAPVPLTPEAPAEMTSPMHKRGPKPGSGTKTRKALADMLKAIKDGRHTKQALIDEGPTEALVEEFGTSRTTIGAALKLLREIKDN